MAKTTDGARYKCGLGALSTVQAISGALPILHAGPGCADKVGGGFGSSGHYGTPIFPCTNLSENEIVFGGENRLKETIENALKVLDAELYVVLTSCSSEIIGDDSEEIAASLRERGKPVVHASTAGFKGNNYVAHDWVLQSIFDQYLDGDTEYEIEKGLVNVFASVPQHDPFWHGNYDALEALLAEIGLKANIIFGHGRGLTNVLKIPAAQFNLVVNPWVGLETAQFLEKKFKTPYLHYPNLPVGAFESGKFLRTVAEYAGIDAELTERVIDEKESKFYYYIERFATTFLEYRLMPKRFSVTSDAQYALAITKFLVNEMGLHPQTQFAMEDVPERFREQVSGYFADLSYDIQARVSFETDGYLVHDEIKKAEYLGYPLIIGTEWERDLAKETGAHLLVISWPVNERLIVNRSYVGYDGGLTFLEDSYSVVLTRFI